MALGVGAGLVTALVTNILIGAHPDYFFAVWGVATLFLVIGNPASGGSSAPELLPGFWRTLSQLLPPGAGVTSLRDVVYFNGHGSSHPLVVLTIYAVLGGAVAMIARRPRTRAAAAAPGDSDQTGTNVP